METDKSGITEEVAAFVETIRFEDFPREAHHIGKRCIIDGIGVILAILPVVNRYWVIDDKDLKGGH